MEQLRQRPSASKVELSAAIDRIRRRFINDLCERIIAIETLRVTIEAGQDDPELVEALLLHIHRIAGIAGSVGFSDVGLLASKIEMQITEHQERFGLSPHLDGEIEQLLSELEALLS